ncbi:MAG: PKD domain-containing protein [Thermoplasmata archaeon]
MGSWTRRAAFIGVLALLLASILASAPGVWAQSTNYTFNGSVTCRCTVPAGVTVDLISAATHAVYTTTTTATGSFSFTTSTNAAGLGPGSWAAYVPTQTGITGSPCSPSFPCAALPSVTVPPYATYTTGQLTSGASLASVSISAPAFKATLKGTVTPAVAGAYVQVLDPTYDNFVLITRSTNSTGQYTMPVPGGTWVLETVLNGTTNSYNFTQITPATTGTDTVNPIIQSYIVSGAVFNATSGNPVPTGGNATLVDLSNNYVYNQPTAPGFYDAGTYGAGFGNGANTFEAFVSAVGYATDAFTVTASGGAQTVSRDVSLAPVKPSGAYGTTISFASGFQAITTSTSANLGNYSTFPDLTNASVGQLWTQLGLDFSHTTTFSSSNLGLVQNWLRAAGPFFPAPQAALTVDGIGYAATSTAPTMTFASTCSGTCGPTTSASLNYSWTAPYNTSSYVTPAQGGYTISFDFRHPTHSASFNYTVVLPTGYVLETGGTPPANSTIVGAGPGGTYTSFTLESLPSSQAYSVANLTVVKYSGVPIANVTLSSSNFAFSKLNIVNATHSNYTAIVGVGENITFSASNSTYPPGIGGIGYAWNFGDGSPVVTTTTPTTYHTYTGATVYHGTLQLTDSNGVKNNTTFTIYAGDGSPTAQITSNATAAQTVTAGTQTYLMVNWSTTLSFNPNASSSSVYSGAPIPGIISGASWNISSYKFATLGNFTAGAGALPGTPFVRQFLGAGHYLNSTTINGTAIAFHGWEYNVTLTVFDYAGHSASTSLIVLVRDTELPVSVPLILNANGVAVTSVIEAADQLGHLQFSGVNSSDPHNGTIATYSWNVTNPGNTSYVFTPVNRTTSGPFAVALPPQTKPYTVNLTVVDLAGNKNYATATVTVGINVTTRPVLVVGNGTFQAGSGSITYTAGDSYTIWVNVTNTVGTLSVAHNVTVTFYLLSPSGSGNRIPIGNSPVSTVFYTYNSTGALDPTAAGTGRVDLNYNQTDRAQITFKPARTGNFNLYANATASNEFSGSYTTGGNQAFVSITINQNPTVLAEEYGAIAAAAIIVIIALIFFFRRRSGRTRVTTTRSTSRGGLERGSKKEVVEEDEDDE